MQSSTPKRTLLDIQNQNVKTVFKTFLRTILKLQNQKPSELKQVDGWEEFVDVPKTKQYLDDALEYGYNKTYKIEEIVHEDVADLLHTCMNLLITHPSIMQYMQCSFGCPEWQWLLMYIDYRIAKKNAKVFPVMLVDNPETPKKEDPKTSNNKMDRRVADIKRQMVDAQSKNDATSLKIEELLAKLKTQL
jgi:hypothetical protein